MVCFIISVFICLEKQLPCKLSHLQGNRVGELYTRFGFGFGFGFVIDNSDSQFVYMSRVLLTNAEAMTASAASSAPSI